MVVSCRKLDETKRIDRRRWEPHVALAGRLAGLGLLDPIEQWWFAPRENKRKSFEIPSEDGATSGGLAGSALTAVKSRGGRTQRGGAVAGVHAPADLLVAERSVAAAGTTAREICERFDFGPLACCAGAMLLAKNQSDLSEEMAAIGLQRLDRESYLRDCQTLFDPAHPIGVVSRCWCGVLAQLTPREINLIDSYLGECGMLHRWRRRFSVTPQRKILRWRPPASCGTSGFTTI